MPNCTITIPCFATYQKAATADLSSNPNVKEITTEGHTMAIIVELDPKECTTEGINALYCQFLQKVCRRHGFEKLDSGTTAEALLISLSLQVILERADTFETIKEHKDQALRIKNTVEERHAQYQQVVERLKVASTEKDIYFAKQKLTQSKGLLHLTIGQLNMKLDGMESEIKRRASQTKGTLFAIKPASKHSTTSTESPPTPNSTATSPGCG